MLNRCDGKACEIGPRAVIKARLPLVYGDQSSIVALKGQVVT